MWVADERCSPLHFIVRSFLDVKKQKSFVNGARSPVTCCKTTKNDGVKPSFLLFEVWGSSHLFKGGWRRSADVFARFLRQTVRRKSLYLKFSGCRGAFEKAPRITLHSTIFFLTLYIPLRLRGEELVVFTAGRHQLGMSTLLDDLSVLKHHDLGRDGCA